MSAETALETQNGTAESTTKTSVRHASHTKSSLEAGLPAKCVAPSNHYDGRRQRLYTTTHQRCAAHSRRTGGTIALVDIDSNRLQTMHRLIEKLMQQEGKTNWKVISSTDRTEVMAGSDYLTNCIEVSGVECVRFDNDIPS
jgi:alpha-galactosidase